MRRAWAALGQGGWASGPLLAQWEALVRGEHHWRAHTHGGYHPVAVDVTGFWRPRLRVCPTTHYHGVARRALPAIPLGLVARVGSAGAQRLALPLAFVRAEATDPRPSTHEGLLDAGFGLARLQEAGATRYVVRLARNSTFRRAGRGPLGCAVMAEAHGVHK